MTTVPRTDAATALPVMTAAGALAAGLMALGQFVRTPLEAGSDTWDLAFDQGGGSGALLLVLAFAAGGAGVTGTLVRRWSSEPGRAGRRALGLAAAGVVSIPAFWTGLPVVLGSGAVLLALRGRSASTPGAAPTVALGLGGLLLAAAMYLALAG